MGSFSSFCVSFFILTLFAYNSQHVDAAFWDGIIGISQVKSAAQYATGDKQGAIQTQKNFLNQMTGVSQIKSLYHLYKGDRRAAIKTQKIYYYETVEPLLENTPILGQLKGAAHIVFGQTERGLDIIKGSTTSTAVVAGAAFGGPAAVGFSIATQGLITAVDSARYKKFVPFGIIDYFANIRQASFGEHVDTWADLALVGYGGNIGKLFKIRRRKKKVVEKSVLPEKRTYKFKTMGRRTRYNRRRKPPLTRMPT